MLREFAMRAFRRAFNGLLCLGFALLVILQSSTFAQDASPEPTPSAPETSTVILDGKPLFEIKTGIGSFSASERANAIRERILKIANDPEVPVESIRVERRNRDVLIVAGKTKTVSIASISPQDATAEKTQPQLLADQYVRTLQESIKAYREERTLQNILLGILYAILTTLALILLLNLLNRFYAISLDRLKFWFSDHQTHLRIGRIQASSVAPFVDLILRFLDLARNVLNLVLIGFYAFLILSFFPWTKPISRNFWGFVSSALLEIQSAIVNYLPNLFTLVLIIFITREFLAFLKLTFREIERGNISVSWLYPDWIQPTFQVIRFFVLALAAAIALPFFPGFRSPAFQGVSLVISALFTLGAAGAVSNIVGGVIAVYTRGFQLGDMIKIDDLMGIVTEKNLLVTRIQTPKNVIITIPNSTVLSSNIINYSALAKDRSDRTGLILHTTITLGYDVPWKNVHEVLIQAAYATDHVLPEPSPFVLQTSLNDFNVAYELNAFTFRISVMRLVSRFYHQATLQCAMAITARFLRAIFLKTIPHPDFVLIQCLTITSLDFDTPKSRLERSNELVCTIRKWDDFSTIPSHYQT
jgi:small-conductance mechanosensitive channel